MDITFKFDGALLPVPDRVRAAFAREWFRIASPGPTLTGQQRIAVAKQARSAAAEQPPVPPPEDAPPAAQAAQRIAVDAHNIDREYVEALEQRGLARTSYLEITGIVSRLSAIDTYCRGVGASQETLPQALPGEPSGAVDPKAVIGRAWVPIVGPAGAISALSALPAENAARDDVHAPLYLRSEEMQNFAYQGVLSRAQIELLAARTSYLNHCRY